MISNENLEALTNIIWLDHHYLMERYPGYWVMTDTLHLLPERMDYNNPLHRYGFSFPGTRHPLQYIYTGLMFEEKHSDDFFTRAIAYTMNRKLIT